MFCIHKHKWGKWSKIYVTAGGNEAQRRECIKCNFIETNLHDYGRPK